MQGPSGAQPAEVTGVDDAELEPCTPDAGLSEDHAWRIRVRSHPLLPAVIGNCLVVPFSNLRNELLIGSCPSEQFPVVSPVSAHAAKVYVHTAHWCAQAPLSILCSLIRRLPWSIKWSFIHRICQMVHLSFSFLVRCPCRKLWAPSLCPQQRSSSLSPARCVLNFCFSTVSTCFQTGSPWSDLPVCGLYRVNFICYCRVQQSVLDDGISMMCRNKMLTVRTGTTSLRPYTM